MNSRTCDIKDKECEIDVVILQRILPHYRIPFFELLSSDLLKKKISLKVFYGQEYPGTVPRTVLSDRPWAEFRKNIYLKIEKFELVWQRLQPNDLDADLVIFEQANRILNNYPLLFFKQKNRKTAFWGHGKNLQASSHGFLGAWKKAMLSRVDWWFAYTRISADAVVEAGFTAERITTVQNSKDVSNFVRAAASVGNVRKIKQSLGIAGDNVCLYCGGLYKEKKLDFLLKAARKIKQSTPDFELIIIGAGKEETKIAAAAVQNKWIHYEGPKYGYDLAPYFLLSKALLLPGAVGLAAIDSFAAELPLITTKDQFHGPEIAYIESERNGIVVDFDADLYACAVSDYLQSASQQRRLREGCRQSAEKYTLENMINNFSEGIVKCLTL